MAPYFIIGSPKAELLNVVEIVALRDIMAMMKYKRPRYKYRTKSTVLVRLLSPQIDSHWLFEPTPSPTYLVPQSASWLGSGDNRNFKRGKRGEREKGGERGGEEGGKKERGKGR